MKLKNSDLEAIVSNPSYGKIFTAEFDDILLVLEIRRQNEDLKPALQAYMDTKKTLIERYCDKDAKTGKPIPRGDGQFSFLQSPSNLATFKEKYLELLDKEIEVNILRVEISTNALNAVGKWSGADLSVIYPFVDVVKSPEPESKVKHLNAVPKSKPEV